MKRYWTLLQQEPLLRQLSLIQLIAYFGAWFSNVAIYTLLISMGVNAGIIAWVAALHFLSGIVQAPLSGAMIDRFEAKKLMIILVLIEIVCTLGLIAIDEVSELILLYLLIFIRMGAASFQFTLEMSLLPKILDGKSLQEANEIHSIIWSLSYTVGMALSGLVVYKIGTSAAFILDSILFMIVFAMVITLQLNYAKNRVDEKFGSMMRGAFAYIKNNKTVFHLMLLHSVVGFTAFDALVALCAKHYYSTVIAVSLGIGLLHSARALGLAIGPLFLGTWINNQRLGWLLIFEALSIGLWALVLENFYFSLIASVFVGFVTTTLWSYTYTLLQHHTDESFYGRVVAYNDMIFLSVGTFAALMIGALAEWGVSLNLITFLLGAVFGIAALYYHWIQKHFKLKEIG